MQKRAEAGAAADAGIRAGETVVFDGMEFVGIPPGEFLMGSTGRYAKEDERPVTRVKISRGIYLGKYEVTQNEWQAVMGKNPSEFSECGRCPVENVSWNAVQEFIGKLNEREGGQSYRPSGVRVTESALVGEDGVPEPGGGWAGTEPAVLLTNRKVTGSRKSLWRVVESYLIRWRVEETIRFIKQSYGLEDIRLLKYEGLRDLVMVVQATAYFACVYLGKRAKLVILVQHIARAAKRIHRIPEFRFYAIADGIKQLMFGRNEGIGPPRADPRLNRLPLFS